MENFESGQGGATSPEVHGFEVAVVTADGETFAGTLVDLHTEDAEASFPRDAGPVLPIGLATTLSFTAPWMRAPIQVDAKVISRVESGASRIYRYRLKFDSDELKRRLSREASRVYNQRTANRVAPAPGESVAVALKLPAADRSLELPTNATADVSVTGRLKDISTGGVGVFLGRKAENVLADTELVEISFELPPSSEPLTLMGWIRHRRLKGNRMSYGIEFDTELSKNFAPQLDRIIHYIVRHQEQE